jgi:chlorobactene glucosyltransferase
MILQIVVLAGILVFAINLILNLIALRRPSSVTSLLKDPPFISVLVPARDEETNIERCVRSLQDQDYPEYEIIVLDDNSTDSTAAIVSRIHDKDPRVQLLRGKPLPEGWAGKPHACLQLARKARGSWLLFLDADTVHQPCMLRSVISIAVEEKVSLLSGMPRQLTSGPAQKIVMPLMYFLLMSWFPVWFLNYAKKPWPTLAIGQFMLFPRQEYWKAGGHEAVKTRIIEDVWFGIEIKKAGGRFICADLSKVMSTNMYSSVASMTEGWCKWMYSIIAMSPVALAGFFIAAYLFFLAPYFWMAQGLMAGGQFETYVQMVLAQVVIIMLMRWACDRHFREPAASFIFHPLGIIYLVLVAFYSAARHAVGAGITWKDRLYNSRSNVN